MKRNTVDVVVVSSEEAEKCDMVGGPETGGSVVATGEKIVPVRAPGNVPHRRVVATIHHETGARVEEPETDGLVARAGEEISWAGGGRFCAGHVVHRGWRSGWGEGQSVDGSGVADQHAG